MVLGGHFLESLSNFQTKLNSYVGGSDDEIAIVSDDENANPKGSKAKNKKNINKATKRKTSKVESIDLDDSEPEEIDVESENEKSKKRPKGKATAPKKAVKKNNYKDDIEDEESPEEEDNSDDEDYGSSKKKKNPVKKAPKKKKGSSNTKKVNKKGKQKAAKAPAPSSRNVNSRVTKKNYSEEDDYISSDEPESDYDSYDEGPQKKGKNSAPSKKPDSKSKLPKPIAVSEMVIDSIKALGDNPKKGSSLRSIKETIEMNWSLNIKAYDSKIKTFITEAIDEGKIERTKGTGFSGRFTIPGLKMKKKKKTKKLGKKYDVEEDEYTPKRGKRDEAREQDKEEEKKVREERWEKEEQKWADWEIEHAKKPKKPKVEKEWEVESIKSIRETEGKKEYLVKFKGISKPRWEPEDNILNCDEAIDEYVDKQKQIKEDKEFCKKRVEEGQGEVFRILNVQFKKVNKEEKREFLIRWKGLGADGDTWEPEEKLSCASLVKKFMKSYDERTKASNERELRDAPKQTERLEYASKTKSGRRVQKLGKGFRKTYAGMDEDDDWKP